MMALSWLDALMLATLALSCIVGVWRGLVYEVLSLLGWFVAYMTAPWLAPSIKAMLPLDRWGVGLQQPLALVGAFLVVLLAWSLTAKLVRSLIQATPLSLVDRLLGAVFGALRGLLILLLATVLVGMTPLVEAEFWQQSVFVPWLQVAMRVVQPLFPAEVVKFIPA